MTSISAAINAYNTYSPQQLVQIFGSSRAAAKAVGVSTRTVERWVTVKGTQKAKPGKASQAKINKAGRQASARPKKITLKGNIRVNSYVRDRTIDFPGYHKEMSDSQWDRLADLAAAGDDAAVWDQMAHDYGGSIWEMELEDGTIEPY